MSHLDVVIGRKLQNLYAIVDPDEGKHRAVQAWLKKKNLDPDKTRCFTDYRQMFDQVGKSIDAVFITAPALRSCWVTK